MGEPSPAERPGLFGRSATRTVAGVVALALVMVLEVVRRRDEAQPPRPASAPSAVPSTGQALATVPVAPTLPPAPPPTTAPSPARRVATGTTPAAPPPAPRPEPTPPPARLGIDFEHGLKTGSLAVFVDGRRVMDERLRSQPIGKVLVFERRHGRVARTLPIEPGRRTVRVRVEWEDHERSETTVARFRGGGTRTLVARLKPVTRSLSLEWR